MPLHKASPDEHADLPTIIKGNEAESPRLAADVLSGRFGRYRIVKFLGEGGMGDAYVAHDTVADRRVALKRLKPGSHGMTQERFLQEVRATARLDHPGIVKIFDAGIEDAQPFYTMEFIDGESLEHLAGREKKLAPRPAVGIIKQAADALAHAHQRRIVHRDVKPANILINAQGAVKLADFGLAKRLDEKAAQLTHSGDIVGTPAYMSPEQAAGRGDSLDGRSDIYSLGCVLYRLLTGRVPFQADTAVALLKKILDENPLDPHRLNNDVPPDVAAMCLKAMEKQPKHRYATAAEFADDLGRFLNGLSVRARPVGPLRKLTRYVLRNRKRVAVLVAIIVACVGILAYMAAAFSYHDRLSVLREQEGGPPAQDRDYAVSFLLSAVAERNAETRIAALTALARRTDSRAPEALVNAANDANVAVRLHVVDLAPKLPRDQATRLLSQLTADTDGFVRAKALAQAATMNVAVHTQSIVENIQHRNPLVRASARRALAHTIPPEQVERELVRLLTAEATPNIVKAEILRAMTRGMLPPTLLAALDLLKSADPTVQTAAAALLKRCTGQLFGRDHKQWQTWLEPRRAELRVACVGLVVVSDNPTLREEDVIVSVGGKPCAPASFHPAPAGTMEIIRNGATREIALPAPVKDLRVYVSHVVFLRNTIISTGEIENRIARAARRNARP